MKFEVEVVRVGYSHYRTVVEAKDGNEAADKAVAEACDSALPESSSTYEVESVKASGRRKGKK